MLMEKKISKGGGITIPANLRRELGLAQGEKFQIGTTVAGDITLRRIEGSCVICGSTEKLKRINKVFVCKGCVEKLKEAHSDDR